LRNLDYWRTILVIDYQKVFYLSDTGRTWKSSYSVKDLVKSSFNEIITSTQDIIKLMKENKPSRDMYIDSSK